MHAPTDLGWWGVPIAVVAGAVRVSTPYLLVSLGETLTEKAGRVNLGLEGTLVMGAMSAYATAYATGSPWLGVLVAGTVGALLGLLHGVICNLPRVNDIALGIALFLLGTGLAFYLGKPFIEPMAPRLPSLALGAWSASPQIRAALDIAPLFVIGAACAPAMRWGLGNTRWGLIVRTVGDNA
ncbi:MAG TPA: ABC transporter permease, partial [Candidatus Methylomirabilis sp.]|nr:ABC transporter permease [Candidatus Methylomirabilis sp.]